MGSFGASILPTTLNCSVPLPKPSWLTSRVHERVSGLAKGTMVPHCAFSPPLTLSTAPGPGQPWEDQVARHRLPIVSSWVDPTGPGRPAAQQLLPCKQAFV